jgi:hypothetical protein
MSKQCPTTKEEKLAKQYYRKLEGPTTRFSHRISKKKLARIDQDVINDVFPSRAAWIEQAIDHFLGDC